MICRINLRNDVSNWCGLTLQSTCAYHWWILESQVGVRYKIKKVKHRNPNPTSTDSNDTPPSSDRSVVMGTTWLTGVSATYCPSLATVFTFNLDILLFFTKIFFTGQWRYWNPFSPQLVSDRFFIFQKITCHVN